MKSLEKFIYIYRSGPQVGDLVYRISGHEIVMDVITEVALCPGEGRIDLSKIDNYEPVYFGEHSWIPGYNIYKTREEAEQVLAGSLK